MDQPNLRVSVTLSVSDEKGIVSTLDANVNTTDLDASIRLEMEDKLHAALIIFVLHGLADSVKERMKRNLSDDELLQLFAEFETLKAKATIA